MGPGDTIARRYELASLAGVGGMSTVYQARDRDRDGELIALKITPVGKPHLEQRFRREALLLRSLQHEAIVSFVDSGVDDGFLYLATEWLDGVGLGTLLRSQKLSLGETLTLIERVASALGTAHEHGIVHRDVKPSNIFLVGGEVSGAKLLDFGIAHWAAATRALTRPGSPFGTPGYMAPEQVRGESSLDQRADVFSLGCVLYECLTGEPAFAGREPMAVFCKILHDDAPRAMHVVPDIPNQVELLLAAMLAKDPAERPSDGGAVAAQARMIMASLSGSDLGRRARARARRDTLTNLEQRLVSVFVAALPAADGGGDGASADDGGAGERDDASAAAGRDSGEDERDGASAAAGSNGGDGERDGGDGDGDDGNGGDGDGGGGERDDGDGAVAMAVAVAVAVAPSAVNITRTTMAEYLSATSVQVSGDLQARFERAGAHLSVLSGGALVAVFDTRASRVQRTAADQAVDAVRCALALRRELPTAAMALATGRAVEPQQALVGDVIDRAVDLLGHDRRARDGGADVAPGIGSEPEITQLAIDPGAAGGDGAPIDPSRVGTHGVRIDAATAALVAGQIEVVSPAAVPQLVSDDPTTPVVAPIGMLQLPSAGPVSFVGRSAERAALTAALTACIEQREAQAVLITGAAGLGKSRLSEEVLRALLGGWSGWSARPVERRAPDESGEFLWPELSAQSSDGLLPQGQRLAVWFLRGDSLHAAGRLHMMSECIRRRAGISEHESAAAQHAALVALAARVIEPIEAARVAVFLAEMLGLDMAAEDTDVIAARADEALMAEQVSRACIDLLAAELAERPLLAVVEDLQWGDRATVDVLDVALKRFADQPFMLLALGRPEVEARFPRLWARHNVTELRLARLPRRAAERMVRELVGDALDPARLAAVIEQADGNPLYLQELVRARAGDAALPDTVMAIVQARLEALEPLARRLLRAASVVGKHFWLDAVATLTGSGTGIERWFDKLVSLELVERVPKTRFQGQREYAFRHDLIHQSAYAMLTEEDRRLGHRLAAEWYERVGEDNAERVAEHYDRGGARGSALPFYLRAAERALRDNQFDDALDLASRGIACGAEGAVLGAFRRVEAEVAMWRGQLTTANRLGMSAMRLLPPGEHDWYQVAGDLATVWGRMGAESKLERLAEALIEERDGDRDGRLVAAAKLVTALFERDRVHRGDELWEHLKADLGADLAGEFADITTEDVAAAEVTVSGGTDRIERSGGEPAERGGGGTDRIERSCGEPVERGGGTDRIERSGGEPVERGGGRTDRIDRSGGPLLAHARLCRARWARFHTANPTAVHDALVAAVAGFEACGDSRRACLCRVDVARAQRELGDHYAAEATLRAAAADAAAMDIVFVMHAAHRELALTLIERLRVEALRSVRARPVERGGLLVPGGGRAGGAPAQADERLAEAETFAQSALRWFERYGDSHELARACRTAALIEMYRGSGAAVAGFGRALALLSPTALARPQLLAELSRAYLIAGQSPNEARAAAIGARDAGCQVQLTRSDHIAIELSCAEMFEAQDELSEARAAVARARDLLLAGADLCRDPDIQRRFVEGVADHLHVLALAARWQVF